MSIITVVLVLGLVLSLALNIFLLRSVDALSKHTLTLGESVLKLGRSVVRTQERLYLIETGVIPIADEDQRLSDPCRMN